MNRFKKKSSSPLALNPYLLEHCQMLHQSETTNQIKQQDAGHLDVRNFDCGVIFTKAIFSQDTSDTSQPAQKKQKTSGNVSIGKLQNKSQLASLVKVNKDKTNNGPKAAGKAVTKTENFTAAQKDISQDSQKDTQSAKVENDSKAGTSALGSLGMLDYSSSEDSDEQMK